MNAEVSRCLRQATVSAMTTDLDHRLPRCIAIQVRQVTSESQDVVNASYAGEARGSLRRLTAQLKKDYESSRGQLCARE